MKTAEVVGFFGSVIKVSQVLGIRPKAIYQWGEKVPKARQYEIEVKTGGQLKSEYTVSKEIPHARKAKNGGNSK